MIEFTVEGMSCNHCKMAINKAVTAVDAQARVEADVATQAVRIDSQADAAALKAAIEDAGYPVKAERSLG